MSSLLSDHLDELLLIVCPNCEHEVVCEVTQFKDWADKDFTLSRLQSKLRCSKCQHKKPEAGFWKK